MEARASGGVDRSPPDGGEPRVGAGVAFGVLGPLTATYDGSPVALGGPKEQLVLACLLAQANVAVSTGALIDAVWGDAPPRSAERTLQAYVSRLRRALEPGRPASDGSALLPRTGASYRLVVPADRFDALRFEELARRGASQLAEHQLVAGETLGEALAMWRGDAYADFDDVAPCASEARRLAELRLAVMEDRFEAELAAGGSATLVAELEQAVREQPFRERRWGQLMLTLYRDGRQRDALDAYQRARAVLVDELGIEPGSDLRHLEAAILDQDPALDRARRDRDGPHRAMPLALGAVGPAFAGRREELAWLRQAWAGALAGTGGFVSVLGPEGMGKTRLVAELAREVQHDGAVVLYGRCDHAHRGARSLLEQTLRSGGASLAAVDAPSGDLAAAVLRYLSAWSSGHPVLVVLDDLHLADTDTLEVVADLAGWTAATAILVIASFRSDAAGAIPGGVNSSAAQLSLTGLEREAVGEVCELYGGGRWSAEQVAGLHDLTAGVPLLVHEHAAEWARQWEASRVEEAAGRATAARARLSASRGELADGVECIQQLAEVQRANLAGRQAERAGHGLDPCPYKGLATFEAADAANFFGRERLVAELVARIAETRVLAVVGPSGSGKSSVVRAGLIPALAAGALPVDGGWQAVVCTPGAKPARSLHDALRPDDSERPGRRLVFVDQFEETFTLCTSAAEREAFAEALTGLAARGDTVVIAIRADHLGHCAELAGVADLVSGNEILVGPMRDAELRRAIELPARRAGLSLDAGLAEVIAGDVSGRGGYLPLLSTALAETWERRHDRTLTLAGYRAAGGVNGALANLAEETYGSLDPEGRAAARRVLLRLCDAGADGPFDVRRRLPLGEVDVDGSTREAIERLVERRLVTVDQDTIEVAHEALLREWPRLRAWLDEDVQGRRVHRQLGDAARAWHQAGEDASELYRGTRLQGALEWAATHRPDLNDGEQAFLDAGRAEAERESEEARQRLAAQARSNRRLRGLLAGVAALLAVSLLSGWLFLRQRRRADATARTATSRELASRSMLALDADPELSILLGLQAVQATSKPLPEAIAALHQAVQSSRLVARAGDGARYLDVSGDGRLVVTMSTSDETAAIVWDTATWTPLRTLKGPSLVGDVAISADGSLVAVGYDTTASPAGTTGVMVWNASTGAVVAELGSPGRWHSLVRFSPDGRLLAVGSSGTGTPSRLALWDVDARAERFSLDLEDLGDARFSGDGRSLLVAERVAERVARYAIDDGRELSVLATPGFLPEGLAVDPSGRMLAVGSQLSRAVQLWDLETGQRRWSIEAADGGVPAWSPQGDQLAIGGVNDPQVRVVDPATGNDVMALHGHTSGAWDVTYLPDGRLASVGDKSELRVWDVSPAGPPSLHALSPAADTRWVVFSPDGSQAVVASWEGTVERIDTQTRQMAGSIKGQISQIPVRPVISPDGRRVGSVEASTGRALIRDTATFETVTELPACSNPVAFSRDASLVLVDGRAACTADRGGAFFEPPEGAVLRSRVVDTASGREILDLGERGAEGAFSPDGRFVAIVARSVDRDWVEVYDLAARRLVTNREYPSASVWTLAIDPGSRWLAEGLGDGRVRVLDWAAVTAGRSQDEAVVFEQAVHGGGVTGLDVSADGVVASAARGEDVVRLSDVATGKRVLELAAQPDPASLPLALFSQDGRYLTYLDGTVVRRYDRDADALIDLARSQLTRGFTEDECREHLDRTACN